MKKIILDWRNLAQIAAHSMLSGTIACSYPTEPEEFAHRIAKRIYCIRAEYPNDTIILANDKAPYWRSSYLDQWYGDHRLEPVAYKGNRAGRAWPFKTPTQDMNAVFDTMKEQLAIALELIVIEDMGLEADDIFGLIAAHESSEEIVGVTVDSDWRQLCGGNVSIVNPGTGAVYTEKEDITFKLIAGDRGDNIMGCMKYRKDGTPSTMWGEAGAKKLIAAGAGWENGLDPAILERNYNVVTLPCPLWDLEEAYMALMACAKPIVAMPEAYRLSILDRYGVTAEVRATMDSAEARRLWIEAHRARLQEMNKS